MDDIKKDLADIRESQIRMEEDVKYHIKRTDLLEELQQDNVSRIIKLEEPVKAKQYIIKTMVEIGKFTGFALPFLAILRYLGKI